MRNDGLSDWRRMTVRTLQAYQRARCRLASGGERSVDERGVRSDTMPRKPAAHERPAFVRDKQKYRYVRERRRPGSKHGFQLVVETNGTNHCYLSFRELYETPRGGQGNKAIAVDSLSRHEVVELASVLFHLAETVLHDQDEKPYTLYLSQEKGFLTSDEIRVEYQTAMERNQRRASRSHLYGLMRMFVERCEETRWVEAMLLALKRWSTRTGDEAVNTKTEQAMAQLGLIDPTTLDS
jgi:hypothetical protein